MRSRPLLVVLCAAAGAAGLAVVPAARVAHATPAPTPGSRSIGTPEHGRLAGGVRLRVSPVLRRMRHYTARGHVYGTPELVGLLERAAARVAAAIPGARLGVGELSRREGGELEGHASHESGRDADVAFYLVDGAGVPLALDEYVPFGTTGTPAPPRQDARFDDRRNAELVLALLSDADVPVREILVAEHIETRVLTAGGERGAAPELLARAADAMHAPDRGHRHENHFHVRIACPDDDRPACRD